MHSFFIFFKDIFLTKVTEYKFNFYSTPKKHSFHSEGLLLLIPILITGEYIFKFKSVFTELIHSYTLCLYHPSH